MIVTEEQVEAALEFKGDSDRAAEVTNKHEMAEVEADEARARAYLAVNESVSVEEKKMRAIIDVGVMRARRDVVHAKTELVRFKTLLSKADAVIETWRTESANARGMEMVR